MHAHLQFAALADATRCAIFEALVRHPCSVSELAKELPVSRPAVSQHLKILQEAKLVCFQKQGARNIYALDKHGLEVLRAYLDPLWTQALRTLKSVSEESYQSAKERKTL